MSLQISVVVNGRERQLSIDPRLTLVHMLRETLGLTGAHVGCMTGNCGACTVILGGATVKSCSIFAADVNGSELLTIEGLSSGADDLHPIQQAFVANQGLQCGYCTPGMVLSAYHLLERNPSPTEEEIRHGISGNLCRCTGYQFIVESIQAAAGPG
jgi:carbon-monoxide dehydrogenase small subunit